MSEPAGGHPGIDALADLDAGLLEGTPAEAGLRSHLAGCGACPGTLALLRATREDLATLPALTMPAAVADRIDAALTAELAAELAAEPAAAAEGRARVAVLAERRRRGSPRWLPAGIAAGVALLVAAAIGFTAFTPNGRSSGDNSATSAARPGGGFDRKAPKATGKSAVSSASGRNYTPTTLAAGVRALLGLTQSDSSPGDTRVPLTASVQPQALGPEFARLGQPAGLAECVAALAGQAGVAPLAVDFAGYQGQSAALIVLPDRDPGRVQAWIVGPACSTGHRDLRHFEYVPRRG